MKKILALALFGLTAVVPITAIPVAAQTVAAEQTVTFAVDNMTCALCPVTVKRAMESVDELRAHFNDGHPDRLRLTVLKDDRNVIADRFGARVSAEVFVFDRQGRLQYRGGIDDARNQDRVAVEYLRTILDQLVDGEEPEWRYQPPKGCCPIDKLGADEQPADRPDEKAAPTDEPEPTTP